MGRLQGLIFLSMKNFLFVTLPVAAAAMFMQSCTSTQSLATFAPEESGLNITKVTDETKGVILGPTTYYYGSEMRGKSKHSGMTWSLIKCLSVSPDGQDLAYLARMNNQSNVMVRKAGAGASGAATQRTFRNVGSFTWGVDDKLYFVDETNGQRKLCSINSRNGSLMNQLTSNNLDECPVLTSDGSKLFFTRYEGKNDYSIWSYELKTGELTNCARGFQPEIIPGTNDEFFCVRNSTDGNSEIWRINFVNGQETLILSDRNRGYTSPAVSPDGKWLLVVGDTRSATNKKKNLDIFVVSTDGSNLMQLTYHPANDACPQWSADGHSIFFLSDRANKDNSYNVWRMNFR